MGEIGLEVIDIIVFRIGWKRYDKEELVIVVVNDDNMDVFFLEDSEENFLEFV